MFDKDVLSWPRLPDTIKIIAKKKKNNFFMIGFFTFVLKKSTKLFYIKERKKSEHSHGNNLSTNIK